MTAAETLRAAAAKLRKSADLALMDVLTNPYWESELVPAEDQSGRYAHGVRNGMGGPSGDLAALFPPASVAALAEWLDFHADLDEQLHALVDGRPDLDEATWGGKPHPALTLARLVLGEEARDGRV